MSALQWPEDARTIIEWAQGGTVDLDRLINEFEAWSNHFAPSAALFDDGRAEQASVSFGDDAA